MTLVGAGEAALPQKLIQGQWPQEGALEVVADSQMRRRGIELGSTISVTGGPELEVVGIASDAGYGFDTAWTSIGTWDEVRSQVRPELSAVNGSVQAFAVGVSGDAALVQARIADAGFDVGTVADAIAVIPGAEQQKTTLGAIVNTTFVVAAIVIGLFFALVTLEKRTQFAVLKAIGMSNRRLVGGIFAQALVASVVGFVAGLALSRLVGVLLPADVPALFLTSTAVSVFVTTIFTGALGAVISFRRVIKIDPATAIGGAA
jgi:putative ABC transport system permease protein